MKCPPCPDCKKVGRVEVEEADFYRWKGTWDKPGVLIQVAFPYLDSDQREMLMTGYCGPCWTKLWEDVDDFGGESGAVVLA